MKYFFLSLVSLFVVALSSCGNGNVANPGPVHTEMNAVYYWKTVLELDSTNLNFINGHQIGRIYLRMFDVVKNDDSTIDEAVIPNASLHVGQKEYDILCNSLTDIEFVPVVYITLDALKEMSGNEKTLAENIVTRVKNMCQYNGLTNVKEMQLDCDWTLSTEESFFSLCKYVKDALKGQDLTWLLSSTIRLHQLSRREPPVDYGVLMVYNTGKYDDPDEGNSILEVEDVEPYLDYLASYPLHLDVAYPTYSWQLIFHNREFVGITEGLDLEDTDKFSHRGENQYVALKDIPYRNRIIRTGDIIRYETSAAATILTVHDLIDERLGKRPHSSIIYHLDIPNFTNYIYDELNELLSVGSYPAVCPLYRDALTSLRPVESLHSHTRLLCSARHPKGVIDLRQTGESRSVAVAYRQGYTA